MATGSRADTAAVVAAATETEIAVNAQIETAALGVAGASIGALEGGETTTLIEVVPIGRH